MWLGATPQGIESQGIVGVEVPVSHRVGFMGWVGAQRHADGLIDPRDAIVTLQWIPVSMPTVTVRVQPGLSVPTGGVGGALAFTPLSTASFDPWLSADAVLGGGWLLVLSGVARVPLYRGWDDALQGPFARGDVRLGRRFGVGVGTLGVSGVRQAATIRARSALAGSAFSVLAATAGTVLDLGERWSLSARLRVPLAVSSGAPRVVGGSVGVRAVVGSPPESHQHAH